MPKELKFDDAKIHDTAPVKIPNSGDIKKYIERALKLEETLDQTKADLKGLYDDADNEGIDRKALKVVVKHKKKPLSSNNRQEVNMLLEKVGDQPMFAFV